MRNYNWHQWNPWYSCEASYKFTINGITYTVTSASTEKKTPKKGEQLELNF